MKMCEFNKSTETPVLSRMWWKAVEALPSPYSVTFLQTDVRSGTRRPGLGRCRGPNTQRPLAYKQRSKTRVLEDRNDVSGFIRKV